MKRHIFHKLIEWSNTPHRKPLILRGARQVGKTHAVRELGRRFTHYVEINFEKQPQLKTIFSGELAPKRICELLELQLNVTIASHETLLFFDETQECPAAITALRYFYEEWPELHVIAAGSLLDFAIEKVGVPVGRVTFLYLYPMSFLEFLTALKKHKLVQVIINHTPDQTLPDLIHNQLLTLLGEYMLTGGMPEAVATWIEQRDLLLCRQVHRAIIEAYQQDFAKYANKFQIKYVELMFSKIPQLICQPFKYSNLDSTYQKRELAPCVDLLTKANVIHKVLRSKAEGIPLGAAVDLEKFKLLFIDIALTQTTLGLELSSWITQPLVQFANKGALCEALIGQEILAYSASDMKANLYYWHRAERNSMAEVDYVINKQEAIIPIEVKSGKGSTLKSLHYFLQQNNQAPYGIRFSMQNYSIYDSIYSYPLYAAAALFKDTLTLD